MAAPHCGHGHTSPVVDVSPAVPRLVDGWRDGPASRTRQGEARGATGVGEKAGLADADEAARQDVLDEAAEKLHGRERHRAPLVAVGVVLPPKRDVLAVEGEQAVIADRDAMGVAPEVPQDGGGAAEGRLRIDDPVGLEERVDEGVPARRIP